ncbi:MAG: DUF423 domain-containing protein [Nitrospiraceae bacterium]
MNPMVRYKEARHVIRNVVVNRSEIRLLFILGCFFAGSGVATGAFGAHALKSILTVEMLAVYDTATRYQMYHAFGLFVVAWVSRHHPRARVELSGWLFALGIILFSGSLYAVSLSGIQWLGAITPLGGVAFIGGWVLLGWRYWQGVEER